MNPDAVTAKSTFIEPLNVEPSSTDVTVNPFSGVTDAVMEPVVISVDTSASSVSAERGILTNPLPSPSNTEDDIEPLILTEPVI